MREGDRKKAIEREGSESRNVSLTYIFTDFDEKR